MLKMNLQEYVPVCDFQPFPCSYIDNAGDINSPFPGDPSISSVRVWSGTVEQMN